MSRSHFEFAMKFAFGEMSAADFAGHFMEKWKQERDATANPRDPDKISAYFSTISCLADLYNPMVDREVYELDESMLRNKVRKIIGQADSG